MKESYGIPPTPELWTARVVGRIFWRKKKTEKACLKCVERITLCETQNRQQKRDVQEK